MAEEMETNLELPGFYYDRDKKRYFRLFPGNNRFNPLTEKAVNHRNAQEAVRFGGSSGLRGRGVGKKTSGSLAFPRAISYQEMNAMTSNSQYDLQECLLQARLKDMTLKANVSLDLVDYRGNNLKNPLCEYLLGAPEADELFGVWSGDEGCSVYRIIVSESVEKDFANFVKRPVSFVACFPPGNKVMDLDTLRGDGLCDGLMCLTSHLRNDTTSFTSLGIHWINREDTSRGCQGNTHSLNYEFSETLFSCSGVNSNTFAVGGENLVRLFTPLHPTSDGTANMGLNDHNFLRMKGKATSLRFNANGSQLFAGTNKGDLVIFDVNNKKQADSSSLGTKSVVYLHMLSDERQVLMGCHENQLLLLDIRRLKEPVLSYPKYANNCTKIPLSVDESVGIVCSSGDDSIVKLWSIKSGKLLHEVPLPETGASMRSPAKLNHCWFSQSWGCLKNEPKPLIFSSFDHKFQVYST